jgi:hypothetical protein
MRGIGEIVRDATPKVGGSKKGALNGASKTLPQGGESENPKPTSKRVSPKSDGRVWQLTQGRDSLRKQLREVRQKLKRPDHSRTG